MGAVTTNVTWDTTQEALVKAYCFVDGTDYDDLLEALFDSAVEAADSYLNNPFEELRPQITVASVVAGDTVTIGLGEVQIPSGIQKPERYYSAGSDGTLSIVGGDALMYTAAAAKDEDDLEFAIGETDTATADNLCELINSSTYGGSYGAVGVPGVLAENSSGVITLTRRYPESRDIYVTSSNKTRLLVRQVRTSLDIPAPVYQWIYQRIKRHFDNRDAVIQENVTGQSVKMWLSMKSEASGMTENFSLLAPYRLEPGF